MQVLARDVFLGDNKRKFLLILRHSKTHTKEMFPQMIKISATSTKTKKKKQTVFCPFRLLKNYSHRRGPYKNSSEQFFVFSDRSPVKAKHMSNCLKIILKKTGFQKEFYGTHSLRGGGRCSDLYKLGIQIEVIKKLGHWKSNVVYQYLKCY